MSSIQCICSEKTFQKSGKNTVRSFYYLDVFCEAFCKAKNILFCYIYSRREKKKKRCHEKK